MTHVYVGSLPDDAERHGDPGDPSPGATQTAFRSVAYLHSTIVCVRECGAGGPVPAGATVSTEGEVPCAAHHAVASQFHDMAF